MATASLTPYPEINVLLYELLAGSRGVLGQQFVGLYVHGSVASHDFNPQRSDIDFVVVTADVLPSDMLLKLEAMHAHLTNSGLQWADVLEGSYIPQSALRRYDPAHSDYPALRVDGSFAVDGHGSDWIIQRHILREKGLTIAGPPIHTLIDPVAPDALRWASRGILREWWQPQLTDSFRIRSDEYQAYAILTMCRILYTMEHGDVASKPTAAQWAKTLLDAHWSALIDRALVWGHGMELDAFDDTLAVIRYTLDRSESYDLPADAPK
jgi:hypothetical protein